MLLNRNLYFCVTDKKTLMSFRVLPFFLPSPARRGVKKQKLSAMNSSALLYAAVSVMCTNYF